MIPTQALQPRNHIPFFKLLKANHTFRLLPRPHQAILLGGAPHHHSRAARVAAAALLRCAAADAADAHLDVAFAQLLAAADGVDGREGERADGAVVRFAERTEVVGAACGGDRVVVCLLRGPPRGEGGGGIVGWWGVVGETVG